MRVVQTVFGVNYAYICYGSGKVIQGVPKKNKKTCTFSYSVGIFLSFANLNENFHALTIKRPKYITVCNKGCEN